MAGAPHPDRSPTPEIGDDASAIGTPAHGAGAPSLAAALVSGDRAAVRRALRDEPVVVPHLEREDGTPQVRVFPAPEGSAASYEVCLFSSAGALEVFLGDDPGREFILRRRDSLVPFLRRHGAALGRVVVDPGGAHAMTFEVSELLAALDGEAPADDPTGLFDESGAGISIEGLQVALRSGVTCARGWATLPPGLLVRVGR